MFTPADETTFWAGYGLGLTTLTETIRDDGGYSESVTLRGLTLARVTGGLDWRLARGIGMGPTVGVEIGRYTATRTETGGEEAFDGDVPSPAFHLWLDVGFRLVILP